MDWPLNSSVVYETSYVVYIQKLSKDGTHGDGDGDGPKW